MGSKRQAAGPGFNRIKVGSQHLWPAVAILLLLVFPAITVGSLHPTYASAPTRETISGDWTITGTVVRTGTVIQVDGNVTIKGTLVLDGSTLTIEGANEVHGVHVMAGGQLQTRNGTVIEAMEGGRMTFTAEAASRVVIDNSTVLRCGVPTAGLDESGIYSETGNFTITNSTVGSSYNGLVANGGSFSVSRTTIIESIGSAVYLTGGSTLRMVSCSLRHGQGPGLLSDGSDFVLDDMVFENVDLSIYALNSTGKVSRSLLSARIVELFILEGGTYVMSDVRPFIAGVDRGRIVSGPNGASLMLVNCSITDMTIEGPNATATWATRFDVLVTRNEGAPGAGAEVELRDRFGSRSAVALTDDSGKALDIIVPYMTKNSTGQFLLTPHQIFVFLEGALRTAQANVTTSDHIRISVIFTVPAISIKSPEDGEWLMGSPVHLEASIEDARPITDLWLKVDASPEAHFAGSDNLRLDMTLPDGWHVLSIRAANDDDRIGTASIGFGIDSEAPVLKVDPVGPYTNQSILTLKGACSSDATIWVGGQMYPVINGRFQVARELQEGANRIEITALDRAQNRDSAVVQVILDSVPPTIIVSNPQDGSTIMERSVVVKGICDPSTVKVSIAGQDTPLSNGQFEREVKGLKEGPNHIKIVAFDVTGSSTYRSITVFVDSVAPEITLSGFPSLTNLARISVKGMTDTLEATVYVNGVLAALEEYSFSADITLSEGENYVDIMAQDPAGNVNVITKFVVLDTEKPVFEAFDPEDGTVIRDRILALNVQVFDQNGVRSVRAFVSGKETVSFKEEGDWTGIIVLDAGENRISLEAVDNAGNIRTSVISYTYKPLVVRDDERPEIWFTTPTNGSVLNEGVVNIEGGARDNVGVVMIELTIGGRTVPVNGTEVWHTSVDLRKGWYKMQATAMDMEGNFNVTSITLRVVQKDGGTESDGKGDEAIYIIAGLVLILLLAGVLFYLYLSNKRMRQVIEEKAKMEEERTRPRRPKARVAVGQTPRRQDRSPQPRRTFRGEGPRMK